MFEKKKVGVALSGGGAKGFAHIGVLKVFEKSKIQIDMISGTSMGAIIGALYCAEPNAKKLGNEAESRDWKKLFDYTFPRKGFIKGDRLEKFFQERLNNICFKDLKIPLFVTAFDIDKEREIIFSKGDVAKAIHASMSIPGIFVPVQNKQRILIDAGIIDPIPTEILRKKGADIVIAINVNFMKTKEPIYNETAKITKLTKRIPGILENASKSLEYLGSEAAMYDLMNDKVDFVININLPSVGILDFSNVTSTIKAGEKAANKSIKEIKALIAPNIIQNIVEKINKNLPSESIVPKIEVSSNK